VKKYFPIEAVLSVAGDKLMCNIDMVYDILNFMTKDNLYTHALPRAACECKPVLIKMHPWLTKYIEVIAPKITKENYMDVLEECKVQWGSEVQVSQLCDGSHEFKDPIQELCGIIGSNKVMVVEH
jgi:hypothetical protein